MSPTTDRIAHAAGQRQLALPLLLFLAGQRPLAFFAGQLLYAAEPLCALFGLRACAEWAEALSDPAQTDRLITMLDRYTTPPAKPTPPTSPLDHVLE